MTARQYQNPPIHEVIIELQFHESLEEGALRPLRDPLSDVFAQVAEMSSTEMLMQLGPGKQELQSQPPQFAGWICKTEDEGWQTKACRSNLSFHSVRVGKWPEGPYVGWDLVYERFMEIHGTVSDVYEGMQVKRAGLRYLNRIAIPEREDAGNWFAIGIRPPEADVRDPFTFQLTQTWARAGGHEDVSARVGLTKIEIEDEAVAQGNQGILLDIDIFNLWVKKAPSYHEFPEWLGRAHGVENAVFEGCVTDQLRRLFKEM